MQIMLMYFYLSVYAPTCACVCVCVCLGYETLELNASDARSKKAIHEQVKEGRKEV